MKSQNFFSLGAAALLSTRASRAEIKVLAERIPNDSAAAGFKFKNVPAPSRGGELAKLRDGRTPSGDDQPADNFFFAQGSDDGRMQIDLGSATTVKQVTPDHAMTRSPERRA